MTRAEKTIEETETTIKAKVPLKFFCGIQYYAGDCNVKILEYIGLNEDCVEVTVEGTMANLIRLNVKAKLYQFKEGGSMTTTKVIYLSGAMKNDPNHEAKFAKWEKYFKNQGNGIVNPLDIAKFLEILKGVKDGNKVEETEYMLYDLMQLKKCTHIFMMNDYESSDGAMCEYYFAKKAGIEFIFESELEKASA